MKQLTPRQGTKTWLVHFLVFRRPETTYTPSGDEKQKRDFVATGQKPKQPTPRQGTKTILHISFCFFSFPRNNLRPVRGRKLAICVVKPHKCFETTYTPSGDEKTLHNLEKCLFSGNNLHPVRGRKVIDNDHIAINQETTYTPSGDENVAVCRSFVDACMKQLTPRQGTKTPQSAYSFPQAVKQLTPRQGTKKAPYPCG